jgi:two-component system nitrogen regulation response regulator GlnG
MSRSEDDAGLVSGAGRETHSTGSTAGYSTEGMAPVGRGAPGVRRVPALTVLAHPDLDRIGDRALLGELAGGRATSLARATPSFAPPGKEPGTGLGDKFLSRTPIHLKSSTSGAVKIERGESRTQVTVDGLHLEDRLEVPAERLEAGAVVVLADRIVLCLHLAETGGEGRAKTPSFGLVGESDALSELRAAVARVADVDVAVLVRGPTGSGKELVARALHDHGPRPEGPFVAVNLGALPPTLAAAELFGARKGAFTGAIKDQPGHFVRAHGGTLFLDEVGEAPPDVQVTLLRSLETGEVMPVGGQTPRRPSVRLVAATDADLESQVDSGDFRAPLLHRLAGYRLRVPALAERREDIGRLLLHFLRRERRRLGEPEPWSDPGSRTPLLPAEMVARLALYDWPGNVRELANVVRELAIDSRGATTPLALSDRLDAQLPRWMPPSSPARTPPTSSGERRPTRRRRKPSEIPEDELLATLREHRFSVKETAAALRVSRTGLYARIDRSAAIRTAADVPEDEIRRAHGEHGGSVETLVEVLEVSERGLRQRLKDLGLR